MFSRHEMVSRSSCVVLALYMHCWHDNDDDDVDDDDDDDDNDEDRNHSLCSNRLCRIISFRSVVPYWHSFRWRGDKSAPFAHYNPMILVPFSFTLCFFAVSFCFWSKWSTNRYFPFHDNWWLPMPDHDRPTIPKCWFGTFLICLMHPFAFDLNTTLHTFRT